MIKTDVSANYKTKLCKKFSATGYCPYGMRCQFIHDISDATPDVAAQLKKKPFIPAVKKTWAPKVEVKDLAKPFNPTASAFVPATTNQGCCGFGNKQSALALAVDKIVYSEILVHSVKVSVQEYQKKMKMF